MKEMIKVVWICAFSNSEVRKHYKLRINPLLRVLLRLKGHDFREDSDYAVWDSNAIKEFERYTETIELHIICPIRYLSKKRVDFCISGVKYHFIRDQHSGVISQLFYQFINKYSCRFKTNRRRINSIVNQIHPKIVHVIGAENPYYSLSALDVSRESVLLVQLQALLMRLVDITKDPKQKVDFAYKGKIEKEIFERADFVGTKAKLFKEYLTSHFHNLRILDIGLAMGPTINREPVEKVFDFVYFAANINKAGLEAIKAFVLAHKINPTITLDIIGKYDPEYREQLDEIIKSNSICENVFFEGLLPSHDDVIQQIRKSRFALLPLKMDIVPNTIIEAMSNGLVVVSTVTRDGTPKLNDPVQCLLLSEQGDYQSMANNMIQLLNDSVFAEQLRENSFRYLQERHSNEEIMSKWYETYLSLAE